MADSVRKMNYCYTKVSNRAGQGAEILGKLKDAGVNLVAFSGFPVGRGKAQLDFVADDLGAVRRALTKGGFRVSANKKGFLVTGTDERGAVQRHMQKLADNRISVTAVDGIATGKKRYGMLLWVKRKDYARAAKILRAK
jgi:hypothetical protein